MRRADAFGEFLELTKDAEVGIDRLASLDTSRMMRSGRIIPYD
jgi:hypothetical protein